MSDTEERKYIRSLAKRLWENRCNYKFDGSVEKKIIDEACQKMGMAQLVHEIVSFLHGEDGIIRVGAAEILGVTTPPAMVTLVQKNWRSTLTMILFGIMSMEVPKVTRKICELSQSVLRYPSTN